MREHTSDGTIELLRLWTYRLRGLLLVLLFTFGLPGLIMGELSWFTRRWDDGLFVVLLCVMWMGQELFVHPERRRGRNARTHLLIIGSFLVTTGIAVAERNHGQTLSRRETWRLLGMMLCVLSIPIGLAARFTLGRFYVPQPVILPQQPLIRSGVYRYIRHPMYTSGLLWILGLCLLLRSLLGAGLGLVLVGASLWLRIREEEDLLLAAFGDAYRDYQRDSWYLFPFIC